MIKRSLFLLILLPSVTHSMQEKEDNISQPFTIDYAAQAMYLHTLTKNDRELEKINLADVSSITKCSIEQGESYEAWLSNGDSLSAYCFVSGYLKGIMHCSHFVKSENTSFPVNNSLFNLLKNLYEKQTKGAISFSKK